MMRLLSLVLTSWLALVAAATAADPMPQWIWPNNKPAASEIASFRKTIDLAAAPKSAVFFGSCDNLLTLFVNGEQVATSSEWQQPIKEDLTKRLKAGKNVIAVRGTNQGGIAAFIGQINIEAADGTKSVIVTDDNWLAAVDPKVGWQQADYDDRDWKQPHRFGKLGIGPWGDIAIANARPSGMAATAEEQVVTLPGFKVELLYSVPKDVQGSWVSLRRDNKGRLIASDQYGGLYRMHAGQGRRIDQDRAAIGGDWRCPGAALGPRLAVCRRQRQQGAREWPVPRARHRRRRSVRRSKAA